MKTLERVKTTFDLPIVTDVHEAYQCESGGRITNIIQIPTFLCHQTDLLESAAKTGRIINIKKGQFCASSVLVNSAEKVILAGNLNVMVCERGTMFGYNDLIVDTKVTLLHGNHIRGFAHSLLPLTKIIAACICPLNLWWSQCLK